MNKWIPFYGAILLITTSVTATPKLHVTPSSNHMVRHLSFDTPPTNETLQLQSSIDLTASNTWFDVGAPILSTNTTWSQRFFTSVPQQFFRVVPTKPIYIPEIDFPLDGSLSSASSNQTLTISDSSPPDWKPGRTDHFQAFNLTGANTLNLTGPGELETMTLSFYVYLEDLQGSTPTLFDSGAANGNFKVYLHDNQNGSYQSKQREVRLVFQVHGNSGGNGPIDGSVQSRYRRIGEHSADFIDQKNHKRDKGQIWLHFTITYDPANNTVDFYINGRHDSTAQFSTSQKPKVQTARIGATQNGQHPLIGRVSDLRLYKNILSPEAARKLGDFRTDLWAIRDIDQWEILRTFNVATNGNDNNDGSAAMPLRTIGAAVAKLNALGSANAPGTRILIHPGKYREGKVTLTRSGTRFNPIVIEAKDPGTVTMSGSYECINSWTETANGSGIWYSTWTNNFGHYTSQPVNHDSYVLYRRELAFMDGEMLRPYTLLAHLEAGADPRSGQTHIRGAPRITDEHAFMVDEAKNKIYIRSTKNPNQCKVELGFQEYLLHSKNNQYIVLRGIKFEHAASFYPNWSAVNMGTGSNLLIEDCEFSDGASNGLLIREHAHDVVIRRCAAHRNGRAGMKFSHYPANVYVHDTNISLNHWRTDLGNYKPQDPAGFGKIARASRIYFERVRICDHNRIGFWSDIQNWDITLDTCYLRDNTSCLWFEISTLNQEMINSSMYDNVNSCLMLASESVIFTNNVMQQSRRNANSYGVITTLNKTSRDEQPNIQSIYMARDSIIEGNTLSTQGATDGRLVNINPDDPQFITNNLTIANNRYYAPYPHDAKSTPHFRIAQSQESSMAEFNAFYNDTTSVMLTSDPFVNSGNITVAFATPIATHQESALALEIPVSVSTPVDDTITVEVQIENITAQQGTDFRVMSSTTLTFEPLERQKVISVILLKDGLVEQDETFRLKLASPTQASLGSYATCTVTIPEESP